MKILTLDEFNAMWDEHRKATLHPLIYTPKPFKITKRRTVKEAVKETRYTESGVPYEVTTLPKQSKEVINTNAVTDLYKAAGKLLFGIEFKRVSAEGKGRLDKKTGKFMWLPSENKGMADLQGLYKGRLICVEIKQPNERLLDSQVKFREWVTNGGGVYIVARSFTEFQERLHEVIAPKMSVIGAYPYNRSNGIMICCCSCGKDIEETDGGFYPPLQFENERFERKCFQCRSM